MTSRLRLNGRSPRRFFLLMKCTEILLQDHIAIRRALDIVDAMLKKLDEGQRIEIFDAGTILRFLRVFGDQYHQAIEEEVLFPALLLAVPGDTSLLELVCEHGGERTLVDKIEEALTSRRGIDFHRSSHQLTSLLRAHCEREGIIVCDLAERYLSKEQDEEITAQFMTHRRQVENHADLSRLERKYPPRPSDAARPDHQHARAQASA